MGRLLHKIALYMIAAFFIIMAVQYGWQESAVLTTIIGVPAYMVFRGLGLGW